MGRPTRRTIGLLLILLSSVGSADVPRYCGTQTWQPFILEAALRFDLPATWLTALILVESAGCATTDGRATQSSAGAIGVTQLMPSVWNRFRSALQLGADPSGPHDNILVGAAYLRELYDRYGMPGAFAAYQAGPMRYEQYRDGLQPLPEATIAYLDRLQLLLGPTVGRLPTPSMWVSHRLARQTSVEPLEKRSHDSLFVVLHHPEAISPEKPDERIE